MPAADNQRITARHGIITLSNGEKIPVEAASLTFKPHPDGPLKQHFPADGVFSGSVTFRMSAAHENKSNVPKQENSE